MYECYVIPIGTMSVCWGNSKKLTAGAWLRTTGEQQKNIFYFWQGHHSSQDEEGSSAIETT